MQTIHERIEEIKLLMAYAVPPENRSAAQELLSRYENDPIALNLLHAFYSYLPEAREDAIREVLLLAHKQGNFLLAARTFHTSYYYLVNVERAEFLGEHGEGIWEEEVLAFFGFKNRQAFNDRHADLTSAPLYAPDQRAELCPACSAAEGEEHTLGCPVEVCPWCGGQLTSCNCRFTQLNQPALQQEAQVEQLHEKLAQKGRIPFAPDQRPGYPTLDEEEEKGE